MLVLKAVFHVRFVVVVVVFYFFIQNTYCFRKLFITFLVKK